MQQFLNNRDLPSAHTWAQGLGGTACSTSNRRVGPLGCCAKTSLDLFRHSLGLPLRLDVEHAVHSRSTKTTPDYFSSMLIFIPTAVVGDGGRVAALACRRSGACSSRRSQPARASLLWWFGWCPALMPSVRGHMLTSTPKSPGVVCLQYRSWNQFHIFLNAN